MGCGKTLQSLVSVALAHCDAPCENSKPLSLVVCPSTLVSHWISEIAKYFPEQKIFCALGLSGSSSLRRTKFHERSSLVNILVISYSALRSDIEYIERESFCCCILDEGHLMKNTKTGMLVSYANVERSKHVYVSYCYFLSTETSDC
jgi:TATA-binding protein-associated factor